VFLQVIRRRGSATFFQIRTAGNAHTLEPSQWPGSHCTVLQVTDTNREFYPLVDQIDVAIIDLKIERQFGVAA